jgi:NTE family protein
MSGSAPPDAADLLRELELFGHPEGDSLSLLDESVEWLEMPAGRRLFTEGDAPDGMYVIIHGRVRFFTEDDGTAILTAEAGPGVPFGEGSLLLGGERSRTAVVVRDALLIRIPPDRFAALMARSPQLATRVARMMAARMAIPYTPPSRDVATETVVLVSHGVPAPQLEDFARAVSQHAPISVRRVTDLAHGGGHGLVLLDGADFEAPPRVVREADRVFVVAAAGARPEGIDVHALLRSDTDPLAAPPVELVLLHERWTNDPSGTAGWLNDDSYSSHHHVRLGVPSDIARFARQLTDHAVGLVLGGGGARGMAHIGVIKAMHELGISIDKVGGSSIGAIVGGQVAMGSSWEEIREIGRKEWASWRVRLDVTLPTVSVSSGRRARRILDETFGERSIEDLWLDFFCTSVNLSLYRLDVHRRGRAATWIRASASAPGLWPPVVDDTGELHIDGGQLNNVPTDIMRLRHRGPVIAVDVCAVQRDMRVPVGTQPPIGVRHLLRRRFAHRYPSLVDTVNRCALVGSLQHQLSAPLYADVYLTPDLSSIGFGGFNRLDEAIEIGYRAAMDGLRDWEQRRST